MTSHRSYAPSFTLQFIPSTSHSTSRETGVQQLRLRQVRRMARPSLRPPPSVFLSPRVLVPRFPSLPSQEGRKRSRVQHARRSTPVRGCPAPASRGWSVAVRSVAASVFPSSSLSPLPRDGKVPPGQGNQTIPLDSFPGTLPSRGTGNASFPQPKNSSAQHVPSPLVHPSKIVWKGSHFEFRDPPRGGEFPRPRGRWERGIPRRVTSFFGRPGRH